MLCLNEGTPVIMALCLLGSVLLIVGGSMWGSGDSLSNDTKKVTGIALFAVSLFLLVLSGVGCLCNQFFCTVDRKSRIAMRLYGTKPPLPAPEDIDDGGSSVMADQPQSADRVGDKDWQEYSGSRASFRSFRSGRNSTRNLRSRTSLRQDRVLPNEQPVALWDPTATKPVAPAARPLPPTPANTLTSSPPAPPQPQQPQVYHSQQAHQPQSHYNFSGNSNGRVPVPVEFSSAASLKASHASSSVHSQSYYAQRFTNGGAGSGSAGSQQHLRDTEDGYEQYMLEHQRRQQAQLTVRPHLALTPSHRTNSNGSNGSPNGALPRPRTPQLGGGSTGIISDPVVI